MATLKDIQNKISAVKKTKQITKAMNMVAASRLRGAQTSRPYAGKFAEVLGSLADRAGGEASPLLVPREEVKKINIVLCTSDRGLCGGFNTNLIEKAESFMDEKADRDVVFSFTNFGKKGRDRCRKNKLTIDSEHLGVVGANFGFNVAMTTGKSLVDAFLEQQYDEVYIVFAEFLSLAKQVPVIKQILPIPPIESSEEQKEAESESYLPEHICEPSTDMLLGEMLPAQRLCSDLWRIVGNIHQ
jgi:F-type H+-transporting ATPase subunit gamma